MGSVILDLDESRIVIPKDRRLRKVYLEFSTRCNLNCPMCFRESWTEPQGDMDWGLFLRVASDLAEFPLLETVHFLGMGEPFCHPRLIEAVGILKSGGRRVRITTNATLLDDEIIDLIKRYNFGLMISLDGPQETHDAMRPFADGGGSFETATRNIKRLMARRRAVTVRCTLSNLDLDRPKIVQFLEEFGFARVAMSRCTGTVDGLGPYDIGPEENAVLRAQDDYFVERLFDQLARGERIKFNPWATVVRTIHDQQNRRMRCGVGRGCTTVSIDGRLYPCHRYVGMDKYVLGHVTTGVDQAAFADYLRGYFSTKSKCETCWAINLCGGYCPWYVSGNDGVFAEPEEWWCDEIRQWYEMGIWMYDTLRSDYPDYWRQLVGAEAPEPLLR